MKYDIDKRFKLEELIISQIINFNKKYKSFNERYKLSEDFFMKSIHKDLMISIGSVLKKGIIPDMVSVANGFKPKFSSPKNIYQDVVVVAQLASTSVNMEANIEALKNYKMMDDLEFIYNRFNKMEFQDINLSEYMDEMIAEISTSKDALVVDDSQSWQDQINETVNLIDTNSKTYKKKGIIGVPTGFSNVDSFSGGFLAPDLIVIGARPSMGKTTLALQMTKHAALAGYNPAFFSLEMSANQLILKMISSETNVDSKRLFLGKTSPEDMDLVHRGIGSIEKIDFVIEDKLFYLGSIVSKIRYHKNVNNISMAVIDYLQLIRTDKSYSREQEVATISKTLKELAKELSIPIIALAQVGRPAKGVLPKRPQLHDLRESGAIENDADVVMFLHRPEYYYDNPNDVPDEEKGLTELSISKGRNIGISVFRLFFKKKLSKFVEENSFF